MTSQPPTREPGADAASGRRVPRPADGARPYDEPPPRTEPGRPDQTHLPPYERDGSPVDRADEVPRTPTDGVPPRAAPGDVLPQHRIRRTRAGGLWVAVAAAALVLLILLIFILQNSQQVEVSFFGADGHLALGVAMLLSAVAGALLVVLVGTARIVQLRFVARRHRVGDAAALGDPDRPARRRFARNRG
jgi:uncharacterized integral membrane protein